MNFYFGNATKQELDMMGTEDLFEHNGEFYYYNLEFGSNPGGLDEVALHDTSGRSLPICVDFLHQLNTALVECLAIRKKLEEADAVHSMLESDDIATVECGSRFNKNHDVIVYI